MTNKILLSKFIVLIITLLFQSHATAGVYKWVDENGQVHYGEQPGKTGAERVTIKKFTPAHNGSDKKTDTGSQKDEPATDETGQDNAAKPKKPKQPKISRKEKRRLCSEARSDIANISSRGRMREINARGEYIYLSEKQRQQRLTAAKKKKREFCR